MNYNHYRAREPHRNVIGCQKTTGSCSTHKADFLELKHQSNRGGKRILHPKTKTKGQSICFLLQKPWREESSSSMITFWFLKHKLSPYLMPPRCPSCDSVSYTAAVPLFSWSTVTFVLFICEHSMPNIQFAMGERSINTCWIFFLSRTIASVQENEEIAYI